MNKSDPGYIKWLLANNNTAVERAILALYNRQDADEQSSERTYKSNGRGFSAFDAKTGSYYARWIMSGRNLSGRHLEKARMMLHKYVRQLSEIAAEKTMDIERQAIQQEATA